MMTVIDICVILSAIILPITAIKGETWNNKKQGIGKLTKIGWLAAFVGLLGLLSSITQAYLRYSEEKMADKFRQVAYTEIRHELFFLMELYILAPVNDTISSSKIFDTGRIVSLMKRCDENYLVFDSLLEANSFMYQKILFSDSLNPTLRNKALTYLGPTWGDYYSNCVSIAKRDLLLSLDKYKEYLSAELMIEINLLLNTKHVQFFCDFFPRITDRTMLNYMTLNPKKNPDFFNHLQKTKFLIKESKSPFE